SDGGEHRRPACEPVLARGRTGGPAAGRLENRPPPPPREHGLGTVPSLRGHLGDPQSGGGGAATAQTTHPGVGPPECRDATARVAPGEVISCGSAVACRLIAV